MAVFHSHSRNGGGGDGQPQSVQLHLQRVATLAKSFGDGFGCGAQAEGTALLHDLGKYSAQFQRRLTDPHESSRDHWSLGAFVAIRENLKSAAALMPAAAILGHHVGLDSIASGKYIRDKIQKVLPTENATTPDLKSIDAAMQAFLDDDFSFPTFDVGLSPDFHRAADMLDTRMLFSALVDADFLATDGHFEGDCDTPYRPRPPGLPLRAAPMLERLLKELEKLARRQTDSTLQALRTQLMEDCAVAGATDPTGAFTLTAPTGAGKTLAMLRFAIEHAIAHSLRRIVLVMPFTNIVQQTAAIYRGLFPAADFGEDYILESHSLAGRDVDENAQDAVQTAELRRRLLSQNWDAPVILTTNVGLLESLHAHRPSRCRKLHRLAGSVILFDEVQTLPPHLATLSLATLSRLADPAGPFRSSVVFATATQPAFECLSDRLREFSPAAPSTPPRWQPREIVQAPGTLYRECGDRVRLLWREETPISIDLLADELRTHRQVACIVNLKRHAAELTQAMLDRSGGKDESIIHLSTNMCAAHRSDKLADILTRLDQDRPVRLISTQCIEAGVDVDFPALYRAMAPLDSIAQAAGRCNRNGRFPTRDVVIFEFGKSEGRGNHPPGYGEGIQATKLFLQQMRREAPDALPFVLNDPDLLRSYYRQLYSGTGLQAGPGHRERELHDAVVATDFATVAQHYRLINQDVVNVLVPYQRAAYQELLTEATDTPRMSPRAIRSWQAKASQHSVSVYRNALCDQASHLLEISFGDSRERETEQIDWWYPRDVDSYSDKFGLRFEEESWVV